MDTKRKRGGQPGNNNALKHGFYSSAFKKIELDNIENMGEGLIDEITLLRICTKRLMDLTTGEEDINEMIRILNTTGQAVIRLGHLLKINKVIGNSNETIQALSIALTEVTRELKL